MSVGSDTFIIDLMKFLESKLQSNWYCFGHHLKIPIEELHRIELTVGQDSDRCTRQVFFLWRRLNPVASWEPIAIALKQSGLSLLSDIVTKRYTNPSVEFTDFHLYDVLSSIPNSKSASLLIRD